MLASERAARYLYTRVTVDGIVFVSHGAHCANLNISTHACTNLTTF